ncbi:MAG: LLM class flavin-dependent oxidoreductase [Dehalococcoidia bacterium]
MKFGLFYELQTPRPLESDQWHEDDEFNIIQEALDQIEFADQLGFDYVFEVEHHFLEEYAHSSAPEVMLAAASQRTKNIRLGHGIIHMPVKHNHPARVAERISTLDLVSNGRVEFGTGEGGTFEAGGFGTKAEDKKAQWEEATRECLRMMSELPYEGHKGRFFDMPARNVIPKPRQKPHPPVWVAASRRETVMVAARLGIGALGFGFETPEEAEERVENYWELVREECMPIGKAINPALVTVGNMMCRPTTEEAVDLAQGGSGFFSFSLGYGMPKNGEVRERQPGREHLFREYVEHQQKIAASGGAIDEPDDESARTLARAAQTGFFTGSPELIRQNLRRYEEAHVDMILMMVQVGDRNHEQTMESLELFGKEVLPEFQERHHLHQQWREQQLDGIDFTVNSSI